MDADLHYPQYAEVSLGIAAKRLFTYGVPEEFLGRVRKGVRVLVQLRTRQRVGVVVRLRTKTSIRPVKPVLAVLDSIPVLSRKMLKLLEWVASYYVAPLGAVIEAAIPSGLAGQAEHKGGQASQGKRRSRPGPFDLLSTFPSDLGQEGSAPEGSLELMREQREALSMILSAVDAHQTKPILLRGVTGSGKTEVYLRATEYVLSRRRSALILVPEISLTPALLALFIRRFGRRAGILHSRLTRAQRAAQWQRARNGDAKVIIGVRSAVFAPLRRLGLIVVDEEHEGTYKQEKQPFYNARDVAVVRASIERCPVVLCGATPSLETFYNASRGKYQSFFMSQRVDNRPLAKVDVVDMRQQSLQDQPIFSEQARQALKEALDDGQQALLFVNRRGFSPFLTCLRCGYIFRCDHCDTTLVYHRVGNALVCHLCGASRQRPSVCDLCHSEELGLIGFGTQRVQEEAARLFPNARILRMDSDAISTRRKYERALSAIYKNEVDLIVGTQIVAKGHNFPHLALAIVMLADTILNLPDFRAAERTFQLLTQVCGRPGRHGRPGRVILQTYSADHYAIKAAASQDYELFYEEEIGFRRRLALPPVTRMAAVLVSAKQWNRAKEAARLCGEILRDRLPDNIFVLGPAEAPIAKLRDRYRFQALVRSYSSARLHSFLSRKFEEFKKAQIDKKGVRITLDVDPASLL